MKYEGRREEGEYWSILILHGGVCMSVCVCVWKCHCLPSNEQFIKLQIVILMVATRVSIEIFVERNSREIFV